MTTFLLHRLVSLLVTLLAAAAIVFVALEVLPGDPAAVVLGLSATPETLAALRKDFGLDEPVLWRFLFWLKGLATGDLGISYTYRVPVTRLIAERMTVTVPLATTAILVATGIGLPAGFLGAARAGKASDIAVMGLSQIGLAIPNFWFGILLVLAFALGLGWLPANGFPGWDVSVGGSVRALILPAFALALPQAAIIARVARASAMECLGEDWVRTARVKGLSPGGVMLGHVVRNAAIPVTTILGLQFAYLVAGAIIVERAFALPGLGSLVFQSIAQHDIIVVKDLVVLFAGMVVVVNTLVDIAHGLIDPRLTRR